MVEQGNSIIQGQGLSFSYDGKTVLKDVSFALDAGECAALVGPNGAGKTTLLRLLSHVLKPSGGDVLLQGMPLDRMNRREISKQIAVVPQESAIGFPFKVKEVVLMGRTPFTGTLGMETHEDFVIAHEAMERLDILHLSDRNFGSLSGGERQRTIIARALTQSPRLLLLDEPATHLDLSHQMAIHDLLLELANEGVTILSVTHDLSLAAEFFPRVMVLKEGGLVADGPTEDVLTEDGLQKVYNVATHVDKNPASGKPRISLVRKNM